jgi:ribulose-phosphate 3-epimerase
MSVEPGKGGQQFIESTYNKIHNLKNEIKNRNLNVKISVDGGINEDNMNTVQTDIVVTGSYLKSRIDNKLL